MTTENFREHAFPSATADPLPSTADAAAFRGLLKRFRVMNALTQTGLSALLGVSQATISRWEKGAQNPDLKMMRSLWALIAQSLPRQDRMIANIVRNANSPRVLLNQDFIMLSVSDSLAREIGAASERLVGSCYSDRLSVEAKRFWPKAATAGFFRGEVAFAQLVARVRRYEGECTFPAIERVYPLYLSDGQIVALVDLDLIPEADFPAASCERREAIWRFDDEDDLQAGPSIQASP